MLPPSGGVEWKTSVLIPGYIGRGPDFLLPPRWLETCAVSESASEPCETSGAPAVSMMARGSVSKLPPEPCETESGDGATLAYFVFQNWNIQWIYLVEVRLAVFRLLGLHLQISMGVIDWCGIKCT